METQGRTPPWMRKEDGRVLRLLPTGMSIRPAPQPAWGTGTSRSGPRQKRRGGFQRARLETLSPPKLQVADRLAIELSPLP